MSGQSESPAESPPEDSSSIDELEERHHRYWRVNKTIIAVLLSVWFLVSCVLAIFMGGFLNRWQIGGFPLGFWIAQQGAIYVFIVLILIYCLLMDREDRRFHVEEDSSEPESK